MHKNCAVGNYTVRYSLFLSILLLSFVTMLQLSLSNASKFRSLLSRPLFSSIRLAMTSAPSINSESQGHLAVHVRGKLTPGGATKFFEQTLCNAKNSVLEKGISRFDVLFSNDDFLLIEVYNAKDGPEDHKRTEHYNTWREAVAPLMASPREAKKYRTLFPAPEGWSTAPLAGLLQEKHFLAQNYLDVVGDIGTTKDCFHPSMLAVLVDVQVVPGTEEAFIEASLKNCKQSLFEPGIHRFDLIQNVDDKSNFVLVEVYNDVFAPAAHKATKHYAEWAETVKSMMAKPRSASKYRTLFPSPLYWHSSSLHTHLGEGASGTWGKVGGAGLGTVTGGGFSFLVPKITVGRGIANKEIVSSMKTMGIHVSFRYYY
jgi:(4S)-4-hydroxy-5-phosphonooxypentane-2,3-dione isomerase